MSTPHDAARELDQLLAALVDGELSYVQQQHLSALLRDDPALQKKYQDYLLLDALLRSEQPETAAATPARAPATGLRRVPRWRTWVGFAGALAAGLLAALTLLPRPTVVKVSSSQADEATDNSVAVLRRAP